jgi:methionyl-tRNA formyltransferase
MKNLPIVCIAGKNEIAVFGLYVLVNTIGKENIRVCLNSDDTNHPSWQPSLLRHASELGVKIVELPELYEEESLVFLSLEFDKIIAPSKFRTNELFNIHFSMLPAYKGVYTACWPILNGEKISGVTLHKIEQGIDTGNIISQAQIELTDAMTSRDLYFKCLEESKKLLEQNLASILDQSYVEKQQESKGSTYFSKASLDFLSPLIDLKQTAENICIQARAYNFREYQQPMIDGYKITKGQIMNRKSTHKPGQYILQDDHLILSTIDYDVDFLIDTSMEIFKCIDKMDMQKINLLSEKECFDVNITNQQGWTPLIISSFEGKLLCCQTLISLGANINQPNPNGTTPFMYSLSYASKTGDFKVAELLLQEGCNIDQADMFSLSAIDYAEKNRDNDIIKFLKGL